MPGEKGLEKVDDYQGSGVVSLGKAKRYAKLFAAVCIASAAVYGYCAAYVFTKGISLLKFRQQSVSVVFFVSLAALIVSFICTIICVAKMRSIDKYDMSIIMSEGNFDRGRLLVKDRECVKGSTIKADITTNGVSNRGLSGFNLMSATLSIVMGASLCCFTTTLGMLTAQHEGLVGVIGALTSPGEVIARCCLCALAVLVTAVFADILKNELCDTGSMLLVLEEGARRATDKDIVSIAKSLNVSSTNIAHVRICKSTDQGAYVSI